jgi:hypothetical protein
MADEPGSTATGLLQASTQRAGRNFDLTKYLQMSGLHGHIRTHRNSVTRIVALEKVADSIPVGDPPIRRQNAVGESA